MYLHNGIIYIIKKKYLTGIFDIENTTGSVITKKFLAYSQKRGQVIAIGNDFPRSYILYHEKGKTRLYISPITCASLLKRL